MTAANRVTASAVQVGNRLRVERAPHLLAGGGSVLSSTRKRGKSTEVATVQRITSGQQTGGRRAQRFYILQTDLGPVYAAPAQTFELVPDA